jgi:hypothetical protein
VLPENTPEFMGGIAERVAKGDAALEALDAALSAKQQENDRASRDSK